MREAFKYVQILIKQQSRNTSIKQKQKQNINKIKI